MTRITTTIITTPGYRYTIPGGSSSYSSGCPACQSSQYGVGSYPYPTSNSIYGSYGNISSYPYRHHRHHHNSYTTYRSTYGSGVAATNIGAFASGGVRFI